VPDTGSIAASTQVSVIIPTYNRAALLGRAIESVLGQSHGDLELIVVDDGSDDGTEDLVRGYCDNRVGYLRLERNSGQSVARNAGARAARHELIAFQDSDDEWVEDKLRRHIDVLTGSPAEFGVTYSDMTRVWADGSRSYHGSPDMGGNSLFREDGQHYRAYELGIQATLMRRSVFERAGGFREDMRCFEDLELFIRLRRICRFRHITEPLTIYYQTDGVSGQLRREVRARLRLLRLYGPRLLLENPHYFLRECRETRRRYREARRKPRR